MPLFTTKIIDLSEATPSEGFEFNVPGHTFQVINASSAAATIRAEINSRNPSSRFDLTQGMGWEHVPYKRLWLSWEAQPGVSIVVSSAGNPNDARPELVRALTASSVSSVTVDNPLASPVPVLVTGQPVSVTPDGGAMPVTAQFNLPPASAADIFIASAWNIGMVQGDNKVLDTDSGVAPGFIDYGTDVPIGKKLRITDAWVDTTGFCGGILWASVGGVSILGGAAPRHGHKMYGLIGYEVPAGTRFTFKSKYAGSQTFSGAVSGILINE